MPAQFDPLAYVNAWNSRDLDLLTNHFAADAQLVTPDLPEGVMGRERIREVAQEWFRTFDDMRMQAIHALKDADQAALLMRVQGTNTGDIEVAPGQRLPATGRRVDYHIGSFITLDAAEKIKRSIAVFDNDDLMRQLGLAGGSTTASGVQRERQPPQW